MAEGCFGTWQFDNTLLDQLFNQSRKPFRHNGFGAVSPGSPDFALEFGGGIDFDTDRLRHPLRLQGIEVSGQGLDRTVDPCLGHVAAPVTGTTAAD